MDRFIETNDCFLKSSKSIHCHGSTEYLRKQSYGIVLADWIIVGIRIQRGASAQPDRIRLRIPSPRTAIPSKYIVILLGAFPRHREILSWQPERLIRAGTGAHEVHVSVWFVFGPPCHLT